MGPRLALVGAVLTGVLVGLVSGFVWLQSSLPVGDRATLITATCTAGLFCVAAFGVVPALLQSVAAAKAADASRASLDLEVVSDFVYGSWMKSKLGMADGLEMFGQRVIDDRSARRAAMGDLRRRYEAASEDMRPSVRAEWWGAWEHQARYVGIQDQYSPANQLASSLADELEVLGLACMSGLAPLATILAGNANNALTDWALCSPWIASYRAVANFGRDVIIDGTTERVDWQRRHAEWFAMVSFIWMRRNYPSFDLIGPLGPDSLASLTVEQATGRVRAITVADDAAVVESARRAVQALISIRL